MAAICSFHAKSIDKRSTRYDATSIRDARGAVSPNDAVLISNESLEI